MSCSEAVCSPDGGSRLTFACDGSGNCVESAQECLDGHCKNGQCQPDCSNPSSCGSGVCTENNQCCPAENVCPDDSCCQPTDEHPFYDCCNNGAQCCDCFYDEFTKEEFCCGDGTSDREICAGPNGDTCYSTSRYRCVNGRVVQAEYACANDVECDVPCCVAETGGVTGPGGVCCGAGTECAAGACVPTAIPCTTTDGVDAGCPAGSTCLTLDVCTEAEGCTTKGTCCPDQRVFSYETPGVPWGDTSLACCPAKQAAGAACDGSNPYCMTIPSICTAIFSWGRR